MDLRYIISNSAPETMERDGHNDRRGKCHPVIGVGCVLCAILALCGWTFPTNTAPKPAIDSLAFSPDASRLAVGTYGQVVVFDTASWQPVAFLRTVLDSARAIAFSPDGKQMAIGDGLPGRDGRLVLWSPASGESARIWTSSFQDSVESVAWRSDGQGILAGADDNRARVFASLAPGPGAILDEHNGRVQAVAFSPRADFVFATGASDKLVKVWDVKTGRTVVNFDQCQGAVTGLAFLPNGNQLVGASLDGRLRWWQINFDSRRQTYGGGQFRVVDAHANGIYALAISADGKRIITTGADNAVIVWDASNGRKIQAFTDSLHPSYAAALSPDGKLSAEGGFEGIVRVRSVEKNQVLATLQLPSPPSAVGTSPQPKRKH